MAKQHLIKTKAMHNKTIDTCRIIIGIAHRLKIEIFCQFFHFTRSFIRSSGCIIKDKHLHISQLNKLKIYINLLKF